MDSPPIHVDFNALSHSDIFAPYVNQKRILVVSHPEIATHYLPKLIHACQQAGALQIESLMLPSGESTKTLRSAEKIWSFLLKKTYHRDSVLIALGGGVITDLTGFAAACYMRGIQIIHCPTSLLAQVDAAIGGKVGVNHRLGKNMIGAFHQPCLIVSDLHTLTTLPENEFNAGLAELIKYGIALDIHFFEWLEQNMTALQARDAAKLLPAIQQASQIKASIVALDEKEKGKRLVLNYGHTIAHAVENLLNYKELLHGEAVAIGMVVAAHLSVAKGKLSSAELDRIIQLLKSARLQTNFPMKITSEAIWATLKYDKKHRSQQLQWVLLSELGKTFFCTDVAPQQIKASLKACGAN